MGAAGRVGLTIVGTVVGAAFGQPALGAWLGSMAGNALFPRDPERQEGPRLDDLHAQISSYGASINKIWGTMRIAGNVIWTAPIKEVKTEEQQGGKGGVVLTNYSYFGTFAIAICEGPIDQILRIWADTKLIYDVNSWQDDADIRPWQRVIRSDVLRNIHIHKGDESQMPDIWIESYEGTGNVPAHRGLCYIVFKDFALSKFGNRIPNFSFEVSTSTNGFVPYDSLPTTSGASGSDNIVFLKDGIYFVIETSGYWMMINTITNELVGAAYHEDIPDISDFDIDERGAIFTTKTDPLGSSVVLRLSRYFTKWTSTSSPIDQPSMIRVFRTPTYPFVCCITSGGGSLNITHRDDYVFTNSETWIEIPPPSGFKFMSMDVDNAGGVIWAICKDTTGGSLARIMRIVPDTAGTVTTTTWSVTLYIAGGDMILYDADTDQVIVGSVDNDKLAFFDAGDLANLTYLGNILTNCTGEYFKSAWRRGSVDGYLYYSRGAHLFSRIDIANRTVDDTWSGPVAVGDWNGGCCYDPLTHSMIVACQGADFDYAKVYLGRLDAVAVNLSDIVEDICEDAGLDATTEIDTSELTETVRGFCVNQRMPARAALQTLMNAYFFDGIESDGKLKFPLRGGSAVVSIPESDLAAHDVDSERPQELITSRQQELELPRTVEVSYVDYTADYQIGVQRASRQITQSDQVYGLQLPIALSHDAAKQICVKTLANIWMERNRHIALVPRQYSYLDPSDVMTLTEDSNIHTVRLEQIDYQGGVLALNLVNEDASVYSSDATGVPLPGTGHGIDWPGPTILAIVDCPLLSSITNSPGVYLATMGMTDAWQGAAVYKSNNGGATWELWKATTRDAVIGGARGALADVFDPFVWDEGGSVNIHLYDSEDSLTSATEADVLKGANHALLGDEIIAWRTATQEADGSYRLSGLLRGRKGTEWATGTHAVGDVFVVLNTAQMHFANFPVDDNGIARDFIAISLGMGWDNALSQSQTCHLRNMMPLAPAHVNGSLNDSNDLTITWIRRARYGGEWADAVGPPLAETTESYEIDIRDDVGYVVRTITTTSQTATYTAAQQTADGLTPGDQVNVSVYQVSSVVGRGFESSASLNQVRVEVDVADNIAEADASVTAVSYAIELITPP